MALDTGEIRTGEFCAGENRAGEVRTSEISVQEVRPGEVRQPRRYLSPRSTLWTLEVKGELVTRITKDSSGETNGASKLVDPINDNHGSLMLSVCYPRNFYEFCRFLDRLPGYDYGQKR